MKGIAIFEGIEIVPIPTKHSLPTDPDAEVNYRAERERALETVNRLLATKRYTILKVVSIPIEGRGNCMTEYHLGKLAAFKATLKAESWQAEDFEEPERNPDGTLVGEPVEIENREQEDGA